MSLIPDTTRALIGQSLVEPVTVVVEARETQRYAHAVGDVNPLYFDEAAAHAAGHRALLAPPTYVTHARVQPRGLDELREDGLYVFEDGVVLDVERMMFGGEEWDFLEPVYVGDRITADTRLLDLDEKSGSKGPFVRVVRETTFTRTDDDGSSVLVARSRQIGIAR